MQMNKFEEKARDFLIDSGIIPAEAVGKGSLFKEEALEQGNLPGVGEGV